MDMVLTLQQNVGLLEQGRTLNVILTLHFFKTMIACNVGENVFNCM